MTHESRVAEFSRLQQMGIKGVKIDFFGGDGQSMAEYYLAILKDAATYHLLVNFHGTTLPRGLERTYPNLVTMESIKGMEMRTFEQTTEDVAASHCAMLPFTRNAFDPMDYTPMVLYKIPKINRSTTSAFELALSVLFTSGIQHYAETPDGMSHVPTYVKDFLMRLPLTWDDSKLIDGYPGKLAIMARKGNNKWYITGINGERTDKELILNLEFLPPNSKGLIINDGIEPLTFTQTPFTLTPNKHLKVAVKGNGGFVIEVE